MIKLAPEASKKKIERVQPVRPDANPKARFTLLGPYDFMDIYEASDTSTVERISRAEETISLEN
jgi:hypothetical protein